MKYVNGDSYEGKFKNDVLHGKGVIIFYNQNKLFLTELKFLKNLNKLDL